jgi:hypothetical protein
MLNAKQLTNNVVSTGEKYKTAAFANVLAIGLYGLAFGAKDSARRSCREALTDKGMAYSTAARQVAFGMDMAALVAKKYPDAPVMTSIRAAETVKEATDTLALFMAGLGVRSGNEAALWAKGDGLALSDESRLGLTKAPVKKEPEPVSAPEPVAAPEPAPPKVDVSAPVPAPVEPVDPVEAVLAIMGSLSDEQLAALQAAINGERKARKAAVPLAA